MLFCEAWLGGLPAKCCELLEFRMKAIAGRAQQLVRNYKTTTGLVGLAVDNNGRENLLSLSAQVLDSVKVSHVIARDHVQV